MNSLAPFQLRCLLRLRIALLVVIGWLLCSNQLLVAAEADGRVAVAKCASAKGSIIRREAEGKPWQVVAEGETLYSGDLLIGLPGAIVDSANGSVRLTFGSDLAGASPLPIIEAAVVVHENKEMDLDFTLDRGRVDVVNRKQKGEARARGRIRGAAGDLVLHAPGTAVALEFISRWPAGARFSKDRKKDEAPAMELILLVLKGEVTLSVENRQLTMKEPPGPAFIRWDSTIPDKDLAVHRLDKLPDWAKENADDETIKKRLANLKQFQEIAVSKSIGAALDEFIASDDPLKRRLALAAMAATDDLERLGNAMANAKQADVWENGPLVLRHWMGRGPGQDRKLYEGLIKNRHFTPVDAETAVQLLHTFNAEERNRPELYETLMDYLEHDKLAIRGLAYWHLHRLVPAGRDLGYDPTADGKAREQAVAKWRKLIPAGKLPPKVEAKP